VPALEIAGLILAAFAAGAVNAVAGGGTLLTFPALLWAGLSPIAANATSTVALVPGSASAWWGYRSEAPVEPRVMAFMAVPSVVGGVLGTLLVLWIGDEAFGEAVPWLILGATALFVSSEPIGRWIRGHAGATELTSGSLARIAAFQLLVAIYGGFFGAGIGILMLAALALAGLTDVHRMNALKNLAAVCINGVAALTFALSGRVDWTTAALMALGAVAGGRFGAVAALRVGQKNVRRAVVGIGVAIGLWMLLRPL
jgi:uncharacterized membrane protein YfcA